jgi:hypothetical protein
MIPPSGQMTAQQFRALQAAQAQAASGVPMPKTDAESIHNVRVALRNLVQFGDPQLGIAQGAINQKDGAIKQVIGKLGEALKTQVPGYSDAALVTRTAAQAREALEEGPKALASGPSALRPLELEREFAARPIEQQAAYRAGTRSHIDLLLGTNANDLQALKSAVKGEGDWNREKLAIVFGPKEADRVFNAVDREAAFRDAYNKIVENSQSAQRLEAAKALADKAAPAVSTGSTMTGLLLRGLATGGRKVADAFQGARNMTRDQEIARILTLKEPERSIMLDALLNARGQHLQKGLLRSEKIGSGVGYGLLGGGHAYQR